MSSPVPDVAGRDIPRRYPRTFRVEDSVYEVPEEREGPEDPANPKDRLGDTKPQLHLVPPALTILASQAMADGAAKYGPYNWREKPVRMTVYISAIQRHLAALMDGEEVTRDTGVPHLGAIAASIGILADAQATGNLIDDRPTTGPAGDLIDRFTKDPS